MVPTIAGDGGERAFLEDDASGLTRIYSDFQTALRSDGAEDLRSTWASVRQRLVQGQYVVVLVEYEWGLQLHGLSTKRSVGHLVFLIFRRLELMSSQKAADRLRLIDPTGCTQPAFLRELRSTVSRSTYEACISTIKRLIAEGETYQVNYTYRLRGELVGSPVALYLKLRERQRVKYGALICMPTAHPSVAWVLSRSPELFVEHRGGSLRARPMKGTAPRSPDPKEDDKLKEWLRTDAKNRAENLMIVDLLRNDIGRIARIGSVRVPSLFSVEAYSTLYQMTSTVEGSLLPDLDFPDVLTALFPCGSITGAPKIQTMKRIEELEESPRGLYTGSIGWIDPFGAEGAAVCPNFCLSVAIRTLVISKDEGLRAQCYPVEYGVGGGIVIDSQAHDEFEETMTKTQFLKDLDPGFELVETMKAVDGEVDLLQLHMERLTASIRTLAFHAAVSDVERTLREHLRALPKGQFRLRLAVRHDGRSTIDVSALEVVPDVVTLAISNLPLSEMERAVSRYKTSYRPTYTRALEAARRLGAFDAVFFDDLGNVTEGARSNVFAQIGGIWKTPPLREGVLGGVMRRRLLETEGFPTVEEPIDRGDLYVADKLLVCNALYGALPATLSREIELQ